MVSLSRVYYTGVIICILFEGKKFSNKIKLFK